MKGVYEEKLRTENRFISTYDDRVIELEKIVSALDDKLDDEVRAINNRIERCANTLERGLKGEDKVNSLYNEIEAAKESQFDNRLSSCRSSLMSEISRCRLEISNAENRITAIENEIATLENNA